MPQIVRFRQHCRKTIIILKLIFKTTFVWILQTMKGSSVNMVFLSGGALHMPPPQIALPTFLPVI